MKNRERKRDGVEGVRGGENTVTVEETEKMSLQTQVAILFFSRGNGLKLKLNLKLMKHILVVTFVSLVINYSYQPCSQQFLSVN